MAARSRRWSRAETIYLISALEELQIMKRVDGRKHKNAKLFESVAEKLEQGGYTDRDTTQVKNKWKLLKQENNKAKAHNNKSGSDPSSFPFYEEVDWVLCGRPLANADHHGIEMGFEESLTLVMSDENISDEDEGSVLEEQPHREASVMSGSRSGSSSCSSTHLTSQSVGERPDSDQSERPGTSLAGDDDSQLTETEDAAGSQLRGTKRRKVPKAKSGYERALRSWSEEHMAMIQEMQDRQNRWAEKQQERREQRERMLQQQEEKLLSRLLEQNSRSTERVVGMMFEGLRSLLPTSQAGPPPSQYNSYPQSRYPVPHQQYHPQPQSQLQNFPTQSENPEDESEYTLHTLY